MQSRIGINMGLLCMILIVTAGIRLNLEAQPSTLEGTTAIQNMETKKNAESNTEAFAKRKSMFGQVFGVAMWPIWVCSALLLTFIYERRKALKSQNILDQKLIEKVTHLVSQQDIDGARTLCQNSKTIVGQAWAQGFHEFILGGAYIHEALTDSTILALKPLKRNLQAISTIGVIAPLLGLFGTVVGMIITFNQISATGGANKAELAYGISIALLTTAGGLIVSIPAIVSGRYFSTKLVAYSEEAEWAIHKINYRYNTSNETLAAISKDVAAEATHPTSSN